MTLGQMVELLRRRLQEKVAHNWEDVDLKALLNLGLHRTQLAIKQAHPDVALHRAIADIEGPGTTDNDLIVFPPGFVSEYLVEMLDDGGVYRKIKRLNFRETIDRAEGSDTRYARTGKWLKLSPPPTAHVTNGIRIWYVPTLTMADDSDIPDIPLVLHEGPIIWANRIALGETGETSKELAADWIEFKQLILETYNVTDADPQYLNVDIDKSVF